MRKNKYNYVLSNQIEKVTKNVHLAILLCNIQKKEKDNIICKKHIHLAGL